MGSIFRSEEMVLCQLFLSSEAAYNCVSELGEIGLVQFRDLNPDVNAFQRKFVHEVRRCDEMERKLRYLEKEVEKDKLPILDTGENPEAPQPREMIDLEATFEKLENELREVNANAETLRRNSLELTELKHVLQTTQLFFDEQETQSSVPLEQRDAEPNSSITQNLLPAEEGKAPVQLGFVAGVVMSERMPMFERMLWRVCRGNVFVRQAEIPQRLTDPVTEEEVRKTVFIIFFQGEQLKNKVKKICEGCRATMYPCPETSAERKEMGKGVKGRLDDLATVLTQTTDHRHRMLAGAAKHLRTWFIKVRKIKAIYHALNMLNLDVTNKCLIAECWIPVADLGRIQEALGKGTEKSGSSMQPIVNRMDTYLNPPTFHRNNKFTQAFQNLIDSYGVANYREINPALYTTTTFPFLFAVMFGDAGHGLLMLTFAGWMVLREKALIASKMSGEIWNIFFGGRYILLLMSLFSLYTGCIYNDIFSKSFNIFGSSWKIGNSTNATEANLADWGELTLDPYYDDIYVTEPYPFGFDPIWQISINKIAFQNSYKMKISIIIGVIHMLFGIVLSLLNFTFFQDKVSILCEFIPHMIFLLGLFGYLCFMVLYKWVMFGCGPQFDVVWQSRCAPSVLIYFINMVLLKKDPPVADCNLWMYEGQYIVQIVLLLVSLIMVPIMLIPKPFYQRKAHRAKVAAREAAMIEAPGSSGNQPVLEEFEFSEVFIEQAIHTIEFVLGSVSHTASYLRLWALSLAHGQLSEVLWTMVMKIGLAQTSMVGSIILYLIFAAWCGLTISILVLMEGLSAFLHTLRLHWVEFQSKFYKGEGYAFAPLTFKYIISGQEMEE